MTRIRSTTLTAFALLTLFVAFDRVFFPMRLDMSMVEAFVRAMG